MNHFAGRMLLVSLLLSASPAWALGVGEPRLSSSLNMPLAAALPLTDTGSLTADDIHVGLASAARFNEAGLARTAQTDTLDFAVTGGPGNLQITIAGRAPLREPVLDTVLDISWPGGQLQRHVAFLPGLNPEGVRSASLPAPSPVPDVRVAPWPVTAQARKGEDLAAVAARLANERSVTPAQMQWALMQANPSLSTFEQPLKRFGPLVVPSEGSVLSQPTAQARTGLAAALKKTPADASPVPDLPLAGDVSARLDQLESRTALLDDLATWGARLSEWQNRLQIVEARQAEARDSLEALETRLAGEEARLGKRLDQLAYQQSSSVSQRLAEPDTSRWKVGDSMLAAGAVFLVIALSSLLVLRRRRRISEQNEDVVEPVIQQAPHAPEPVTPSPRHAASEPVVNAPVVDALKVAAPLDAAAVEDVFEKAVADREVSGKTEQATPETTDNAPAPFSTPSPAMPELEFTMGSGAKKAEAPPESEQQDIVDIFISHGRLDAAREMLEGELTGTAGRPRTRLKLMEVLAALGLSDELEQHADVLATHDDDEIRKRAMALTGRDFMAGAPLTLEGGDGGLAESSVMDTAGSYGESDIVDSDSPTWALEEVAFDGLDQDNGSLADTAPDERLTRAHLLLEEDKADEAMALLFDVMDDGDPASRDAARHLLERYETN
ncbi:type IV pilus assembly protein FimV [Larsenimonas rhizosphaerae]|uniref:FimV N-terminal domain-containing protein n=1 Tax=Larsenimonas rhizosphaerae TaxID=2944682 RepID=A0AA41ZKD8_9GAMM|nr:hypothetical protein [Larsenimonas rhizosphaerae]MCX2523288.1 hypothetical protein [Larsenimonas rhizosphaerae]